MVYDSTDYDIGDEVKDRTEYYVCPICDATYDNFADDSQLMQCEICHNLMPISVKEKLHACPWCYCLPMLAEELSMLFPWQNDAVKTARRRAFFITRIHYLQSKGIKAMYALERELPYGGEELDE